VRRGRGYFERQVMSQPSEHAHNEEQSMTSTRLTLAVAALTLAAACGRNDRPAAAADSTAATAATAAPRDTAAGASGPARLEGFQNPESAKYDGELDVWYVSNVNGTPVAKDRNGYISRLKGDGTMDSLKFIVSGAKGVTLNAPKGMALQGDTIWVADIQTLRGLNRRTGLPVVSIDVKGSKFLNDVALGPDGIYITDTGVEGSAGGLKHSGPDRIYRVGPDRKPVVALESDSLAGPNGITWDGKRGQFIVVPFAGNVVRAWAPGSKAAVPVATTKGQLDGVELLDEQHLLITSWADSSLFTLDQAGTATTLYGGLPSPADIGVDTKRNRVAIPLLMENRVEFRALPASGKGMP
jgi:sugar lactone lactonase YvrE